MRVDVVNRRRGLNLAPNTADSLNLVPPVKSPLLLPPLLPVLPSFEFGNNRLEPLDVDHLENGEDFAVIPGPFIVAEAVNMCGNDEPLLYRLDAESEEDPPLPYKKSLFPDLPLLPERRLLDVPP